MNNEFVHFIITRIGLGVRDDAFYRDHLELARLTIVASLSAQTNKDFYWLVAIDIRAPGWVDEVLTEYANLGKFKILISRRDPFVYALNPVDKKLIKSIAAGRNIITTRVDDDDFLHVDFVSLVQGEFLKFKKIPAAITFSDGINMTSDGYYSMNYPWIGLGLSVLSGSDLAVHCYKFSHTTMNKTFVDNGGSVVDVRTPMPIWMRTWRFSSDSSAARGFRVNKNNTRVTSIKVSDFGATQDGIDQLLIFLGRDLVGDGAPVFGGKAIPKLVMKSKLISSVIEMKKNNAEKADDIEFLAQLMYIIK